MKRYVIVGMGAAGIAAAETIKHQDPAAEIIVISAEKEGYYSRPALAYYLSNELTKNSLYPFTKSDFAKLKIQISHNHVVRIYPDTHRIMFKNGKYMSYERLLLAPGARANRPQIKGVDLKGVIYLDSFAQTKKIIRMAKRGKNVVVVGGGITALEIVEGLRARKMKVHFFLRGNLYWNRVLDPTESEIILSRLKHDGVIIHKNTEVAEITGKREAVSQVITNTGDLIPVDMVAFAIGITPRTQLAISSGLDTQRGIRVNQYMETNQELIYAAGDAAEIFDPETSSWTVDSLWHIARQQGVIAGLNMAGRKKPYVRRIPINVTRLAGLTTTIIGQVGNSAPDDECTIVRGESETWQLLPDAVVCQNNFEVNRLRIMVGAEKILGAILIGDQSLSLALEELITQNIDITPIRDHLLTPGLNLGEILINYWKDRKESHAV
jgi:NADPH-dependent 2,4-dienoyl-CoA reductase/sulfur reductase-like enzyme